MRMRMRYGSGGLCRLLTLAQHWPLGPEGFCAALAAVPRLLNSKLLIGSQGNERMRGTINSPKLSHYPRTTVFFHHRWAEYGTEKMTELCLYAMMSSCITEESEVDKPLYFPRLPITQPRLPRIIEITYQSPHSPRLITTFNMATCSNSFASRSADIQQRTSQIAEKVAAEQSWLETRLKPKKITARYPIKGKALLFSTCGFGSLGDALFGYNSGTLLLLILSNQVGNTHSFRYHVWSASQPSLRPALLQ